MAQRDSFGSKFGAIMALAGSAVGLGNIWKFPYEAGENGGAAFILLYIVFSFLFVLPIMLTEFVVGRHGKSNVFGCFKNLAPNTKWKYFSIITMIGTLLLLSFYTTISGWTLNYLWLSISNYFEGFSSQQYVDYYNNFVANPVTPVIWQIAFTIITGIVIMAGVKRGIEKFCKTVLPILFVIIIIMGIRACSLTGSEGGIKFLFYPDFSKITGKTILDALGLSFFSLSVGMGILLTYASYIRKQDDLVSMSVSVTFTDTMIAICAGIAIFPAVFAFGVSPASGPGLVFLTLPQVFAQMSFGFVWSTLFFCLLFFAALTSTISLLEVLVSFFMEELHKTRGASTIFSVLLVCFLGVFCTLSFGALKDFTIFGYTVFGLFDFLSSNLILPFGAIFLCLFAGWKLDRKELYDEIAGNRAIPMWLFKTYVVFIRYIAPLVIVVIFFNGLDLFD